VDWAKVNVFARETSHLDALVARAVDAIVLGRVPDTDQLVGIDVVDVLADPALPGSGVPVIARWTLPQLKDAIRAAIRELDAAQAAKDAEEKRRKRHVRVEEDQDGTAELVANLPAEAAAAVFASLTNAAKAAKAVGDPRTLDQLRADELVHRATRGVTPAEYQTAYGAAGTNISTPCPNAYPDTDFEVEPADSRAESEADSGPESDPTTCPMPVRIPTLIPGPTPAPIPALIPVPAPMPVRMLCLRVWRGVCVGGRCRSRSCPHSPRPTRVRRRSPPWCR